MGSSFGQILQLLGALITIIGLILLSAWLARKFGAGLLKTGSGIRVLSVLPLGNKEKIAVIEVDGTKLVIGVTPQSISTLHVMRSTLDTHNTLPLESSSSPFLQREQVAPRSAIDNTNEACEKGDFAQKLKQILSKGQIES